MNKNAEESFNIYVNNRYTTFNSFLLILLLTIYLTYKILNTKNECLINLICIIYINISMLIFF